MPITDEEIRGRLQAVVTPVMQNLNQQLNREIVQFGDRRGFFVPGTEKMVRGFKRQEFVDVDTGDVFFFNPDDEPVDVVDTPGFLKEGIPQMLAGDNQSGFEPDLVKFVQQFKTPQEALAAIKAKGIKVFKQESR